MSVSKLSRSDVGRGAESDGLTLKIARIQVPL